MSNDIHSQIVLEEELHVPKGFSEAVNLTIITKNSSGNLEWIDQAAFVGPPGTLTVVTTIDTTNPVELNSISNIDVGTSVLVKEDRTDSDYYTMYVFDANNTQPETAPYIMNTSLGGSTNWIAIGGAFTTQALVDATGSTLMTIAQSAKLAAIEAGSQINQTDAEIKIQYENNTNTNSYTDSEQSKLSGIETNATADQTDLEIKTAYENNTDTNAYTDAEQTKLAGLINYTHPDHTGEVVSLSDGVQTLAPTSIINKTIIIPEITDHYLISDSSNGGALAKAAVNVYGTFYQSAISIPEVNTNSEIYLPGNRLRLVTPKLPLGDYELQWSFEIGDGKGEFIIDHVGTGILAESNGAGIPRYRMRDVNSSIAYLLQISGTQTFDLNYRTKTGAAQSTFIRRRALFFKRVK